MRDLYRHLNIEPGADLEQIRDAIASCHDPDLKADATRILLQRESREVYDRVHGVLAMIGQLRVAMDLTESPHWTSDLKENFSDPHAKKRRKMLRIAIHSIVAFGLFLFGAYWISDAQVSNRQWKKLATEVKEHSHAGWRNSAEKVRIVRQLRDFVARFPETLHGRDAELILLELRNQCIRDAADLETVRGIYEMFPGEETGLKLLFTIKEIGLRSIPEGNLEPVLEVLSGSGFHTSNRLSLESEGLKRELLDRLEKLRPSPSPHAVPVATLPPLHPREEDKPISSKAPVNPPEPGGEETNHGEWMIDGISQKARLIDFGSEGALVFSPALKRHEIIHAEHFSQQNRDLLKDLATMKALSDWKNILHAPVTDSEFQYAPKEMGKYRFYLTGQGRLASDFFERTLQPSPIPIDGLRFRSEKLRIESEFNYLTYWIGLVSHFVDEQSIPNLSINVRLNQKTVSRYEIPVPRSQSGSGGFLMLGHRIERLLVSPGDELEIEFSKNPRANLFLLGSPASHVQFYLVESDKHPRFPMNHFYSIK